MLACQNSGGIGAIIFNTASDNLNFQGTVEDVASGCFSAAPSFIPTVTIGGDDGARLLAALAQVGVWGGQVALEVVGVWGLRFLPLKESSTCR